MDKISINLIPKENTPDKKLSSHQQLFFRISVVLITALVVVVAGVGFVRFNQNSQLDSVKQQVATAQARVDSFSQQQAALSSLQQRLDIASTLTSQDSFASRSYVLLSSLLPPNVTFEAFSGHDKGFVTITSKSSNLDDLKTFFDALIDPKLNQGSIASVNLDSFGIAKNSGYSADLTVTMK